MSKPAPATHLPSGASTHDAAPSTKSPFSPPTPVISRPTALSAITNKSHPPPRTAMTTHLSSATTKSTPNPFPTPRRLGPSQPRTTR